MKRIHPIVLFCALALMLAACSKPATDATATPAPSAGETATPAADVSASPSSDAGPTDAASPVANESPSEAASPPSTSATAAAQFTDLSGVYGADKIGQLAALGVFARPASTTFAPNKPTLRREFVRWLYAANNALQTDAGKQIHPAPAGEAAYFKDVSSTDGDFAEIQGMQDAGISVGFPDKTFGPDLPITREQSLAIAAALNCTYSGVWSTAPNQAYTYLPAWKDKSSISKTYAPILAGCGSAVEELVGRAYGKVATLRPKAPVTHSEAALMMWKVNNITAAQAQAAAPTATP